MNKIIFSEGSVTDLGARVSLDSLLGGLWVENLGRNSSFIYWHKKCIGLVIGAGSSHCCTENCDIYTQQPGTYGINLLVLNTIMITPCGHFSKNHTEKLTGQTMSCKVLHSERYSWENVARKMPGSKENLVYCFQIYLLQCKDYCFSGDHLKHIHRILYLPIVFLIFKYLRRVIFLF